MYGILYTQYSSLNTHYPILRDKSQMTNNTELDFSKLPRYKQRKYVPGDADMGDVKQVVELFEKLEARQIKSAAELEKWLLDLSELSAALSQESERREIRMTCQTDDPERAAAHKHFVQTVLPAVKPISHRIDKKYIARREEFSLDEKRYQVLDRSTRADIELFRQENVPLQTKQALLCQDYQTVVGAMTVEFRGKERTLPEMGKFLLEPDRPLREEAWRLTAARYLKHKDKLEDIFDKMFKLRVEIAANAGCKDYRDYMFKAYHRFDYTPEDCRRYHDTVEKLVLPLSAEIQKKRAEMMKLEPLRPWDTSVDPQGRAPLKPFTAVEELRAGARDIFKRLDPELGAQFAEMDGIGLLDLASRKGKAPGGYQATLAETRLPFIFMNAVGVDGDVRTLLHEGGHAFHTMAVRQEPLTAYRHAPMEFCEVASMSMELLAGEHMDVFYKDEQELKRSKLEHLEEAIDMLPWVAIVDAYQHWLYTNPKHDRAGRRQAWLKILDRFTTGQIDYTGLEEERAHIWHRQLHIFEVPFYYIEYGIAQLGAFQLWDRVRKDGKAALADYRKALALGGSRPLPELFEAAGLKFDFSEKTIAPAMELLGEELAKL